MEGDANTVQQMDQYKTGARNLMLQGFKVDALLGMMNHCSDKCELQYKETGIQNAEDPQVQCYTNCLAKAYKLSKLGLE